MASVGLTSKQKERQGIQTEKVDPIMLALERESKGFDPSVYLYTGDI